MIGEITLAFVIGGFLLSVYGCTRQAYRDCTSDPNRSISNEDAEKIAQEIVYYERLQINDEGNPLSKPTVDPMKVSGAHDFIAE